MVRREALFSCVMEIGRRKVHNGKKRRKKRTREQRGTRRTGERTGGFRHFPDKLRYIYTYIYKYIVGEKQIYRYLSVSIDAVRNVPQNAVRRRGDDGD